MLLILVFTSSLHRNIEFERVFGPCRSTEYVGRAIAGPGRRPAPGRGPPRPRRWHWAVAATLLVLRSSAVTVPGAAGSLGAASSASSESAVGFGRLSGVGSAVVRVRWWVNVNSHDRRDNRCYGTVTARSEYTHLT